MAPWLRIIEAHPLIQGVLKSPVPLPETVLRRMVAEVYKRVAFHKPGAVDSRAIASFTSHFADPKDVARYLATGRTMMPELKDPFKLEQIACPVLVVWGKQDRMVLSKGAQRVVDVLPDTEVALLDQCGHCPQVECPDRFTELLLEFPPLPLAEAA
jgi:pimeloyl-ACP methyl ester carboxylesterase